MITHTHIHTQVHKHTLAYTLDSSLYTRTSTHPHPIHPMCVHIGVYESMRESVWRTGSQSTMFVVNKRERERHPHTCLSRYAQSRRYQSYKSVCVNVRVYTDIQTHANTQTHASIRASPIIVHTHQHTPTSHTPDVCSYRSIPIHACTYSLPRSHTSTGPLFPLCSPSYPISLLCCLRVRLQQRCHHLQPCSVDYCQMQRQPVLLRKSRQQAMSAHYTRSQPATRQKGCVLLPAAPL